MSNQEGGLILEALGHQGWRARGEDTFLPLGMVVSTYPR